LDRTPGAWRVRIEINGSTHVIDDADAEQAYGLALCACSTPLADG
jgi:hypothetical protein